MSNATNTCATEALTTCSSKWTFAVLNHVETLFLCIVSVWLDRFLYGNMFVIYKTTPAKHPNSDMYISTWYICAIHRCDTYMLYIDVLHRLYTEVTCRGHT